MDYPSFDFSQLLPEMQPRWPLLEEIRANVQPPNPDELTAILQCSVISEDLRVPVVLNAILVGQLFPSVPRFLLGQKLNKTGRQLEAHTGEAGLHNKKLVILHLLVKPVYANLKGFHVGLTVPSRR